MFRYDKPYLSCKDDVHLTETLKSRLHQRPPKRPLQSADVRCSGEAVDSKTGHFPTETQLSHAFVVGLWLDDPGSVIVIRATSLWDAD